MVIYTVMHASAVSVDCEDINIGGCLSVFGVGSYLNSSPSRARFAKCVPQVAGCLSYWLTRCAL